MVWCTGCIGRGRRLQLILVHERVPVVRGLQLLEHRRRRLRLGGAVRVNLQTRTVTTPRQCTLHFLSFPNSPPIAPLPYLDLDGGCVGAVVELAMQFAAVQVEHKLTQLARLAAMCTVGNIESVRDWHSPFVIYTVPQGAHALEQVHVAERVDRNHRQILQSKATFTNFGKIRQILIA